MDTPRENGFAELAYVDLFQIFCAFLINHQGLKELFLSHFREFRLLVVSYDS